MESNRSGSPGRRRLVVIDGANSIYRAFFAIPNLRAPDGTPTGAAYGFVNMMIKVIREERPDLLVVAFDPRGGSFRNRLFPEYKAGRDAQPEDLSSQIPLTRELIDAFRVPLLEVPDFEADDVIATLVANAPDDIDVSIVSTDKDLMQLVSERVSLLDGIKDRRYGPSEVEERFGVPPDQILDLRSLVGDPSDNIPGVKGIGEKGAAKLILEWGTLERLLENAANVSAKRAREALQEQTEAAQLSKQLATLRDDVPLPDLESLERREPDRERLRELYTRLGFVRLLDSLDAELGEVADPRPEDEGTDIVLEIAADSAALEAAVRSLSGAGVISVVAVAEEGSAVDARPLGLALAVDSVRAVYFPVRSAEGSGFDPADLAEKLAPLLSGESGWTGSHTKRVQSLLAECGTELPPPIADVEVAAFLIESSGAHPVATQSLALLGRRLSSWEDLAGRGAKAVPAGEIALESLASWAGSQVCAVSALLPLQRERLEADGLLPLYEGVELPLTGVLSRMERAGVRIDEEKLAGLSHEYEAELARIEAEIYELAGERFLVSSPKQLQVILFEKLKLPVVKKTKTGYSTAEDVLEQLAAHHELPSRILAWRRLSKLKSTYLDALPPLVSERTGRIHPSFHQSGAATGRLSATQPNVQNIPIRVEEGARIREAFVPAEGNALLSADYSQVELRILAHYSGDESLIEAFREGDDIHRRTAAEIAGIDPSDVSSDQRARAKAVNFGIIYGSSAFGLANQLGIATADAQATIDAYFERYKGVRRFLDDTLVEARERGYVVTLLGRRRYLPDLGSRNRVLRQAAERMAVNSVIQGTEADLVKRAMVDLDRELRASGRSARMILQMHDELVFEVPEAEIDWLRELARSRMQDVVKLRVPLVVDVGVGANWRAAH